MSLNFSIIFCSKIGFLMRGSFYKSLEHKIFGQPFFPVALNLQLVQNILVLVHALRLVHAEEFYINLVHGQDVCVPSHYGKIDDAAPPILHPPSPCDRKEPSCSPADVYRNLNHCLPNDAEGSGGFYGTN